MPSTQLYRRLLTYVKPYSSSFILAISMMVVVAITEPLLPALLQPLLDGGFVKQDPFWMQWLPIFLLLIALIRGGATWISSVTMTWVATQVVHDLRQHMFDKLLKLPTSTFDNTSSGVLMSKVVYDVNRVMQASTETLVILVRDSIAILGLLTWMLYLNWQLSLIMFAIVPFIVFVVRFVSRQLRGINITLQDSMGDLTRILEEAISGNKLVKVFAGQNYETQRFQKASDTVRVLSVKTQITSGFSVFVVEMLTALVLAIIIYIATYQISQNAITVGGFVSLFTAMGMLFAPIKRLTKVNDQLQQGLAAAESVFNLIDQPAELDQGTHSMQRLSGAIQLQNLTFRYAEQEAVILHNLNLQIHAGETVAFVGSSGSGKTTIANLLPRFYPIPAQGVYLDTIDINELPLKTLRENIALVSQEIVLFNDTVAANIAYGSMAGASRAEIEQAAKQAYAYDFIQQMPQGFETMIGERGVKLSGGQRQRLAIARALLKRAPILIFDEATSALDAQSELEVQHALEELHGRCTLLIIAHRLSTIAKADRIIVMNRGQIIAIGTHAELIAQNGHYAQLYHSSQLQQV